MHNATVTCACGRLMVVVASLGPEHFRCANCRTRVKVESPLFDTDRTRCIWPGKKRCENDPAESFVICEHHMLTAAQWAVTRSETRQAILDQFEEREFWHAQARAEDKARKRLADMAESARKMRDEIYPPVDVVYYVRLKPDQIKIGTTAYLAHRMRALRVVRDEDILAAEPGGRDVEKQRHRQFAALRINAYREDFRPGEELMVHIKEIRREHGSPFELIARRLAEG